MKKLALVLGAVATALTSATTFAATSGQIGFQGLVIGQTCQIQQDHVSRVLTLPTVRANQLTVAGQVSAEKVSFPINLINCEGDITAGVKFDENVNVDQVPLAAGTLVNTSQAANSATNVHIQLMHNNQGINLGAQSDSHYETTSYLNDVLEYEYEARYYATGKATPGLVETLTTFRINYK